MNFLHHDSFTSWLREHAYDVGVYQPGAFLGSPPLGHSLNLGKSLFVYRVAEDQPQILIIVLFEKTEDRHGLRSPFLDFIKFINLIKKSNSGIEQIKGHVEATSWRPEDSLENPKIAAFYKKYMTANHLSMENGIEWVSGNLLAYESPR